MKGEHKKPEHVKQPEPIPENVPDVVETPEISQPEELIQLSVQELPIQEPPMQILQRPEIFQPRIKRPNPLLEPSYNPKVMAKQISKYEGVLNPQAIEIELRGRLPSYDVDKAIQKYSFSMDIP